MNESRLKILMRLGSILKKFEYASGLIEVYGRCSLTKRDVIRYFNPSTHEVFEYYKENWVLLDQGVCGERAKIMQKVFRAKENVVKL